MYQQNNWCNTRRKKFNDTWDLQEQVQRIKKLAEYEVEEVVEEAVDTEEVNKMVEINLKQWPLNKLKWK
jgi:hypothetical protein